MWIVGCAKSEFRTDLAPDSDPTPNQQSASSDLETSKTPAIHGKVISVLDGDSIDILDPSQSKIRIRFYGIDAPETGQPFSRNAKQFVSSLAGGKVVEVIQRDKDRYERIIGDVYIDGRRLSEELVKAGLAWHYIKYAPHDRELADAESRARQSQVGLWGDKRHVAPWEWRKLSKEERNQLR